MFGLTWVLVGRFGRGPFVDRWLCRNGSADLTGLQHLGRVQGEMREGFCGGGGSGLQNLCVNRKEDGLFSRMLREKKLSKENQERSENG